MKNIIGLILIMLVASAATAQDRTVSRTLATEQTLYDYTGQAADTVGLSTTDTLYFDMVVNKNHPVLYNIQIDLEDAETLTGNYDVKFYGKVFSTDSYTEIDVSNTALSGDVNLTFNSDLSALIDTTATTAAPFYRYFRIMVDGAGITAGQAKVNYVYWKFYER
jgi:hypothetical protein